ncbi:Transcriptional regulator, LysR family [Vulgatibacter incomptus]|uniref:Transcriptional regulator, LysR family n=1 Tax=Vulgatibacter incomptus TaxID=1391653 RepID=A0A0K1PIF0_9BACT|nr:Transcriptional regulator, LysR family [Vulgatibacter incomptus]
MNLHLLRLFARVAEHRSFSRAADELRIGQPAVSKGVKELEAQLGVALLERVPGRVEPTEAGRKLLVHARSIFASEREAEAELAGLEGLEAGSLRIGASTTVATWHLPPLLGRFHQEFPGVSLSLKSANTETVARLLLDRELDSALVEGPIDDPRLRQEPWRTDELVLVASPSTRWRGAGALSIPRCWSVRS